MSLQAYLMYITLTYKRLSSVTHQPPRLCYLLQRHHELFSFPPPQPGIFPGRHSPPACLQLSTKPRAELPSCAWAPSWLSRQETSIQRDPLTTSSYRCKTSFVSFPWNSHWRTCDCLPPLGLPQYLWHFATHPTSGDSSSSTNVSAKPCWAQSMRPAEAISVRRTKRSLKPILCPLLPQRGQSQRHQGEVAERKMCLPGKKERPSRLFLSITLPANLLDLPAPSQAFPMLTSTHGPGRTLWGKSTACSSTWAHGRKGGNCKHP